MPPAQPLQRWHEVANPVRIKRKKITVQTAALKSAMKAAADEAQAVAESSSLSAADKKSKMAELETRVKSYRDQLAVHEQAQQLTAAGAANSLGTPGLPMTSTKSMIQPRRTSPLLAMPEDAMREMHDAIVRRKAFRAEIGTKANSGDGLSAGSIPQYGGFIERLHEPTRILDLMPVTAVDSPVIETVQHASTTGSAAMVAAGTLKPTVTLNTSRVEVRVRKLAALAVAADEDLLDFATFQSYIGTELTRIVIDLENEQLLTGDGTGENMLGLLSQTGILTRAAGTGEALLDVMEEAITDLRVGPSFAEPTGIVLHPTTWSLLRRSKDSQGRYLVNPDPTSDEASSLWGVPVSVTTSMTVGEALVADFQLGAQAYVRQGITIEADYGTNGFEMNSHTFRVEMREGVFSPRPSALMHVTGLVAA